MLNINQNKKIAQLDNEVKTLHDENNYYKSEMARLSEELHMKEKLIATINHDFGEKEMHYREKIADMEQKLEYTTQNFHALMEKYEKVETELTENVVNSPLNIEDRTEKGA
jgi:predicted  nucleic acid-binding Zn-ribbon protein